MKKYKELKRNGKKNIFLHLKHGKIIGCDISILSIFGTNKKNNVYNKYN